MLVFQGVILRAKHVSCWLFPYGSPPGLGKGCHTTSAASSSRSTKSQRGRGLQFAHPASLLRGKGVRFSNTLDTYPPGKNDAYIPPKKAHNFEWMMIFRAETRLVGYVNSQRYFELTYSEFPHILRIPMLAGYRRVA